MYLSVMQDSNKRTLAAEQDQAQLEMQIQSYRQSRGLFSFVVSIEYLQIVSV